jgi:hypothetical protein
VDFPPVGDGAGIFVQLASYASLFLHYRPADWATTLEQVCPDADPTLRLGGGDAG